MRLTDNVSGRQQGTRPFTHQLVIIDGQADFARCHSQGTGSGCCTRSSLLATPMAVRCEFMAFPSSCHALSVYHVQPAANCSVR